MGNIESFLEQIMTDSDPTIGRGVWNQEEILEGLSPQWSYIDGCMLIALKDMYEVTHDPKYFKFIRLYLDTFISQDGYILGFDLMSYNSDAINEGKVLLWLFKKTNEKKYKYAIEQLITQINYQPRTPSGSFWHKLIYPYQVWLDGLYMVQPFYLEYELTYNQGKNLIDIKNQFKNAKILLQDGLTGLLYHGYDETRLASWANNKTGTSSCFWARSIGWYAMALVDSIELLQENGQVKLAEELGQSLNQLATALLRYRDRDSGMFYQVIDQGNRNGNYLETSGTCAIAYAFLKGARLQILDPNYRFIGQQIFDSVCDQKLENHSGRLVLIDICLVAGLGGGPGKGNYLERDGTYDYYISEPTVENDAKGIGPFIYAYSEILKLKQVK